MYENSIRTDTITIGRYPIGTIATYTCDATYSIVGRDMRECTNSGEFSGSDPTCQRNSYNTLHVKLTCGLCLFL